MMSPDKKERLNRFLLMALSRIPTPKRDAIAFIA